MALMENYECEGQLSLSDCFPSYEDLYPIPRLSKRYLNEEGWLDDWHYADKEQPTKGDYYYTFWQIKLHRNKEEYHYTYTTALFYEGKWYLYNSTTHKRQPPFRWYTLLIGWVAMPTMYQQSKSFIKSVGADIDKEKYMRREYK